MERYWKSHEVLEDVWKDSKGQTKNLLNGIILVDAAYVHLQKGESAIFFSILNRSLEKFKDYPENFYDIDIEILLKDVGRIIRTKSTSAIKICLK
jgi:predicted metal-dependent hydrolase